MFVQIEYFWIFKKRVTRKNGKQKFDIHSRFASYFVCVFANRTFKVFGGNKTRATSPAMVCKSLHRQNGRLNGSADFHVAERQSLWLYHFCAVQVKPANKVGE